LRPSGLVTTHRFPPFPSLPFFVLRYCSLHLNARTLPGDKVPCASYLICFTFFVQRDFFFLLGLMPSAVCCKISLFASLGPHRSLERKILFPYRPFDDFSFLLNLPLCLVLSIFLPKNRPRWFVVPNLSALPLQSPSLPTFTFGVDEKDSKWSDPSMIVPP